MSQTGFIQFIYIYIFQEKTKTTFIENISATAFINSFYINKLFFLTYCILKRVLQVVIYIIYTNEPDNSNH